MPHIHIAEVPWQEQRSPAGKYHSFCRNISVALGCPRNAGTWAGGHPFDLQIRRIPPGASVCPFHAHLAQAEFFYVLAGSGTVRVDGGSFPIAAGDAFFHPPGEAHQLINSGDSDLEVFIVADNPQLDAFRYPDSDKWGLRPPGLYFRIEPADYFDGEEAPVAATAGTFRPAPAAELPKPSPFAERRCAVDSLPWDRWESPRGRFRGAAKEISIALGAKRNTPTGLGGHSFEVELDCVAPGESPCPFHSHAGQWEAFYILAGAATVRVGEQTLPLRGGDVVLHPPGEAHQIRNASATEDLTYLLIADNPPADYWFYPDSKKWGLRSPRMFFRTSEVEYYDGEE